MARKRAETVDTIAYQGRAILHFHPKKHMYTVSVPALEKFRVYQPGVTSVLGIKDKSGPLCHWTAAQCEVYGQIRVAENQKSYMTNEQVLDTLKKMKSHYRDVKAKAAEIGNVVHDYLHATLLAKQHGTAGPSRPSLSEVINQSMLTQANGAIDAGLEFFEKHKLVPLTMERPVWSPTFGFIGTDDFIGLVDDELCVVDYKTSKRLYADVWMQTAAYAHAYMEEYPDCGRFGARWGVNTGKDGRLDAQRRPNGAYFESDLQAFLAFKTGWHWDRVENGGWPIETIGSLDGIPVVEDECQLEW